MRPAEVRAITRRTRGVEGWVALGETLRHNLAYRVRERGKALEAKVSSSP